MIDAEGRLLDGKGQPQRMAYVLVCRQCGDGDLPMPFESPAARGHWASEHTKGTSHNWWFVEDQPLDPPRDLVAEIHRLMVEHDAFVRSWRQ